MPLDGAGGSSGEDTGRAGAACCFACSVLAGGAVSFLPQPIISGRRANRRNTNPKARRGEIVVLNIYLFSPLPTRKAGWPPPGRVAMSCPRSNAQTQPHLRYSNFGQELDSLRAQRSIAFHRLEWILPAFLGENQGKQSSGKNYRDGKKPTGKTETCQRKRFPEGSPLTEGQGPVLAGQCVGFPSRTKVTGCL